MLKKKSFFVETEFVPILTAVGKLGRIDKCVGKSFLGDVWEMLVEGYRETNSPSCWLEFILASF